MRILIASDIHGAVDSVQFLQEKANQLKPQLCVLLGDYLYHGPRNPLPSGYTPKDVALMLGDLTDCGADILAVRGNCDAHVDEEVLPFPLSDKVWIQADGRSILACHGHMLGRYDPDFSGIPAGTIVLTGHTHVPVGEARGEVIWWNPGSVTLPKSGYPRSYAFYEDGVFTVYDLQDNIVLQHSVRA